MADDQPPDNVTSLYPHTPLGARELSVWFAKLANRLAKHQLGWEPDAFALVLLNHGKMRIYRQGFRSWELWYEAARALINQYEHDRHPQWSPCAQQERRRHRTFRRRQARADAEDAKKYSELCPHCRRRRFETVRGLTQHLRTCQRRHPRHDQPMATMPVTDSLEACQLLQHHVTRFKLTVRILSLTPWRLVSCCNGFNKMVHRINGLQVSFRGLLMLQRRQASESSFCWHGDQSQPGIERFIGLRYSRDDTQDARPVSGSVIPD